MAGATAAQIMDVTGRRDPKSLRRYTRRKLLRARMLSTVLATFFPSSRLLTLSRTKDGDNGDEKLVSPVHDDVPEITKLALETPDVARCARLL
jgi:hypothetical protein